MAENEYYLNITVMSGLGNPSFYYHDYKLTGGSGEGASDLDSSLLIDRLKMLIKHHDSSFSIRLVSKEQNQTVITETPLERKKLLEIKTRLSESFKDITFVLEN